MLIPPRTLDELAATKLAALDLVTAQRDAALDALCSILRDVHAIGGYMTPEQQQRLRGARALLCEAGRPIP